MIPSKEEPAAKHAASHSETAVAEILSPLARSILELDAGSAYGLLVVKGQGNPKARQLLAGVRPGQLIRGPVADEEAAKGLLAGLWLRHDWLHQSHEISQSLGSMTGSFWHAIMHRREGDFSNAKYWYARCRDHPALRTLAVVAAAQTANPIEHEVQRGVANNLADSQAFDPFDFVDTVEAVSERPADAGYASAVAIQRVEWHKLFAACAFDAAGAGTLLGGGIESW